MKKLVSIVTAGSMMAIAAPAMAQDADAFTGFRIEGLVGYDSTRPGSDEDIDNADEIDQSIDDIAYGVGVGYDMNMGGLLLGVEGEWMESEAKTEYDTTGFPNFGVANVEAGRDLYAGIRVGAPLGERALVYAKGGYANARMNVLATDNVTDTDTDVNLDGWRLGGGAEYAVSDNIFVKAEYRYSNYGEGEIEAPSGLESDRFDLDVDRHQVVAGVGLRF